MTYLLDTNLISDVRRGIPAATRWLASIRPEQVHFSVVSFGEIQIGIERKWATDRVFAEKLMRWFGRLQIEHVDRIVPITLDIALEWGRISAGRTRGAADAMIAATAIVNNLIVVTRNTRDFGDLPLKIVNPWSA